MNKKLGELKVDISADRYNKMKMIKVLENAGYVLVLDYETISERYYIVAQESEE